MRRTCKKGWEHVHEKSEQGKKIGGHLIDVVVHHAPHGSEWAVVGSHNNST